MIINSFIIVSTIQGIELGARVGARLLKGIRFVENPMKDWWQSCRMLASTKTTLQKLIG